MEKWTVSRLLDWTTEYFKKQQLASPHLEAEILLAHALNIKRIQIYTNHDKVLHSEELAHYKGLIQRRAKHEPIAYIIGSQPFMGLDIIVNQNTLIPRPETEELVEDVIEHCAPRTVLDLCTGSGVIAVTLAKYLKEVKVIGTDLSKEALEVAKKNAEKHGVADNCQFLLGNLFEPIKEKADLIVTNPPYIPTPDLSNLEKDVKDWEPKEALDGGVEGLDFIKQIIEQAPNYLTENGSLFMEFGLGQDNKIKELAQKYFKQVQINVDSSGKPRVLLAGSPNCI